MPSYPLSETIATGDAAHADKHNEERDAINDLYDRVGRDTGWRNVSSLLINGWTGSVYARRVGALVSLVVVGLNSTVTPATANSFLVIPSGFRPRDFGAAYLQFPVYVAGWSGLVAVDSSDAAALRPLNATGTVHQFNWFTDDAFGAAWGIAA